MNPRQRATQEELNLLMEFAQRLVIKDEDKALEHETMESSRNAYYYISARMETDTLEDYGYSSEDYARIPQEERDRLLQQLRKSRIDNYVEANPYYRELWEKYDIDPMVARLAHNYQLLYAPTGILPTYENTTEFVKLYTESLTYYRNVLHTEAFKAYPLFNNFVKLLLVFMTMQKYISAKIDHAGDMDFYDRYALRNMFISYGLDFFDVLPVSYQRRILRNINYLLRYKGTDRALVSIVSLFGFDSVQVFRYYLAKDYEKDIYGKPDYSRPELKFFQVPVDTTNIEKEIMEAPMISYESFIIPDPYWQANKEEIMAKDFNYVNTKYMSIGSALNLLRDSLDMSYFLNMVMHIREKTNYQNELNFVDDYISPNPINLIDALIALTALSARRLGFVDRVIKEASQIRRVYGFSYSQNTGDEYYIVEGQKKKMWDFDLDPALGPRELKIKDPVKTIDGWIRRPDFINIFVENRAFRELFEEMVVKTNDYNLYRKLWQFWRIKMTRDNMYNFFGEYETYTDYLRDHNEDLYDYVTDPALQSENADDIYKQKINQISVAIDAFLDTPEIDLFLRNNNLASEYFKEQIFRLVEIFKSYTTEVRDLTVNYRFDSKPMNMLRIMDPQDVRNAQLEIARADVLPAEIEEASRRVSFEREDHLSLKDGLRITVIE